jgi:hypothetical protein
MAESLTMPVTYKGYNSEGELITTLTATDANNYINPSEVQAAIKNLESVAEEEMNNICNALNNVAPDADEAVIIQGTKMTDTIEDICTAVKSLPTSLSDSLSEVYNQAVSAHNSIQAEANAQAKSAVWSSSDKITKVSP